MSNDLAIATVTAALSEHIRPAVENAVAGAKVTLARPHTGTTGTDTTESPSVNLYLYQVTQNAALRNADLPMRGADGALRQRPASGYDLHYLLTFYGAQKELEPERLLGAVIRTLHARPVLGRDLIENLITDPDSGFPMLAASNLHQAVETVKFNPIQFTLEELSKLWSVFLQTPYTLSAAYAGTAVLIESDVAPAAALPVRTRQIWVDTLRPPQVERVLANDDPLVPVQSNSRLFIRGRQLNGEVTRVRLGAGEFAPQAVSASKIEFDLSGVPSAQLRAGVLPLQVMHYRQDAVTLRLIAESNVAAVTLCPRLSNVSVSDVQEHDGVFDATVALDVTPPVAAGQRLSLLLNGASPTTSSYSFTVAPPTVASAHLDIAATGLAAGDYLVRLQVDGALSQLAVDGGGAYTAPKVTIA